jgi:hypothetical protein
LSTGGEKRALSEFADRFSEKIQQNSEAIKGDLESGIEKKVEKLLKDDFQEKFYSEEVQEKNENFRVLASDAGRNDIEFKNNTRLYIVQAATVDSDGDTAKKLDTGTLKPYSQEDYESFLQRASEIVELESILERLDPETREKTYILIDGTLLTRLLVEPEELNISEQRDKRLDLVEKFQELLEIAEKNEKVTVAGVSKDSNSSVLYRTLLKDIIKEKISGLDASGLEDTKEFLEDNFEKINYSPEQVRTSIENLREGGADVSEIEELLERYRSAISDTEMVRQLAPGTGFTQPLRATGIKSNFYRSLDSFDKDNEKFFDRNFPQTLLEKDRQDFMSKNYSLMEDLKDSPSVISFYWLPNESDLPLRIDLLDFGRRLEDAGGVEFVEPESRVRDILELLATGYAGEGMHNVWISQADNAASLKNSQVENIYKPLLANQLGENLRKYMRRRDKRV